MATIAHTVARSATRDLLSDKSCVVGLVIGIIFSCVRKLINNTKKRYAEDVHLKQQLRTALYPPQQLTERELGRQLQTSGVIEEEPAAT